LHPIVLVYLIKGYGGNRKFVKIFVDIQLNLPKFLLWLTMSLFEVINWPGALGLSAYSIYTQSEKRSSNTLDPPGDFTVRIIGRKPHR
jgi:hypothetical protein